MEGSSLTHNPLHAKFYADRAGVHRVSVVENVRLARDTFRVRFACPQLAQAIVPGQFVMLRLADLNDPLLGRPLALYDTWLADDGVPAGIDVVYLVVGKLTRRLAEFLTGQSLEVWGPLGNGFSPPQSTDEHLVMVAGGIGQTPFVALAREALGLRQFARGASVSNSVARKVTLCYGARSAEYLAGIADFEQLGVEVRISTDDGSRGHRGFVTDLLKQVLAESPTANTRVVCCGPEPMMAAVAKITAAQQVTCQVSLETPMACGLGICFSCVAPVCDDHGDWDYKRTCVEGPVFDAREIAWDQI
jgi:dihydroorotate dehydrogenase electron transfer subunit